MTYGEHAAQEEEGRSGSDDTLARCEKLRLEHNQKKAERRGNGISLQL